MSELPDAAPQWQRTYEARSCICRSIDALTGAWPNLNTSETNELQALVNKLEALRNKVEARSDRERSGTSRSSRWRA